MPNLRRPRSGEPEAVLEMMKKAMEHGLASKAGLDTIVEWAELWLEGPSLRAKITESYPDAHEFAIAFVPANDWFPENSYTVAPLTEDGVTIPTVLVMVRREAMAEVRRSPRDLRLQVLLEIEANRLANEFDARGLALPPAVAKFFEEE